MIRNLQKQFVRIATLSLLAVMVVVISAINGIQLFRMNEEIDSLLAVLSENDGRFPDDAMRKKEALPPENDAKPDDKPDDKLFRDKKMLRHFSEETPFETRYFLVRADAAGDLLEIDTGHIAAISSDDAGDYAGQVLSGGKTKGYLHFYKYQVTQTDEETIIVFLDCQNKLRTAFSFLATSVCIGCISVFIVFVLIFIFSRRAIAPVAESVEKQKQFITDAGHELKTPISIISANTEVLELTSGKNEWTTSIRNQTKRLSELVRDLLTLARMDEEQSSPILVPLNFSDCVSETAAPFVALADTNGQSFLLDVTPHLSVVGNEDMLRQLVSILCDNALKYTPGGGKIRLSLTQKGRQLRLCVENTCELLPTGNLDRLFDRFYRGDASRSRETGGYGIGLSIAKAIVEAHKGVIHARPVDAHTIAFIVQLPV